METGEVGPIMPHAPKHAVQEVKQEEERAITQVHVTEANHALEAQSPQNIAICDLAQVSKIFVLR